MSMSRWDNPSLRASVRQDFMADFSQLMNFPPGVSAKRKPGDERYMEQLIHDLTRKVDEFNAVSGKPYKLSLAIGSTLYQTADLDSDSFLRQIDIKMYESKNRYYSQSGTDRRQRKKVNNVKT